MSVIHLRIGRTGRRALRCLQAHVDFIGIQEVFEII